MPGLDRRRFHFLAARPNSTRIFIRHIWQNHKDRINEHRDTEQGKAIYRRRKETVERSFVDSKQLHDHRYARLRGISKALSNAWDDLLRFEAVAAELAAMGVL
ncbi:hypothetical protein GSbR_12460 [Geobacter sp. SVR]|nr:hypothetical protein GSVR_15680 [Geobacter sp. SVR]GCF84646.1 hypothetical protein GSbR_12460 [Geobacter sp. SVR]